MKNSLAIFEGRKIRRLWDEKKGKWYFSVPTGFSTLLMRNYSFLQISNLEKLIRSGQLVITNS